MPLSNPFTLHPPYYCRLSTAAAHLLPRRLSRRAALGRCTSTREALAEGREQSAPYLPRKQPLGMAPCSPAPAMAPVGVAALRWRRACQAVLDARELLRCLDMLADRMAPADDRLHASIILAARLQAYTRGRPPRSGCWGGDGGGGAASGEEALAWALMARRRTGVLRLGEHCMQELYITGGSVGVPA